MAVYEALLLNTVVPQIQAAQAGDSYVMVVNATTPALRITQTGTGDSILVEDAANPDSSPFVVTAAGDVGIGTSSPSTYNAKLVSYGSFGTSTPAFSLVNASAENASNIAESQYWLANSFSGLVNVAKIGAISGTTGNQYGSLYFSTSNAGAPTERMRLDAAGNLGIGTSSPGYKLDVQIDNSTAYNPVSGSVAVLRIGNNYGSAGNTQALITHYCSNYSSVWNAGLIETSGGAYTGAYIIQNRTGASTYAERARITSDGDLLVGTTVTPSSSSSGCSIEDGAMRTSFGSFTGAGNHIYFINGNGTVGTISSNGTTTSYNTSSDYRLKDNPQPLTNSGSFIDALKPKTWDWKADGSKGVGFIAHEVQEVSPGTVLGAKDAVDADGNPVMQAMEYGSAEFIANIVAELQSLRARVAQLEQGA